MEESVDDSYVQILNLKTKTRIACCKYKGPARTLAFSSDGQYFVAAGAKVPVIVWNLKAGTEWRWLTEHAKPVWSVAFSPDDKFIVTSSEDETVHIWFTDIYNLLSIAEALIQPDPPVFKPEIRSSLLQFVPTEANLQDEDAAVCDLQK